jgi:DNA-binding CsgD family transcriptional regulator
VKPGAAEILARDQALELIGCIYDASLDPERWKQLPQLVSDFVCGEETARLGFVCSGGDDSTAARSSDVSRAAAVPSDGTGDRTLTAGQHERMEVVLPHLSRALAISRRLADADLKSGAASQVLERLGSAVVLIDSTAHVVFANTAAKRLCDQANGLALKPHGAAPFPRLFGSRPRVNAAIQEAIAACLEAGEGGAQPGARSIRIAKISTGTDYVLHVAPLSGAGELALDGGTARLIGFISDPDEPGQVDRELLTQLYRLTAREAGMLELMASGASAAVAARAGAIMESTARSHVKHILRKLGVSRQSDVVRIVAALMSVRRG